MSVKTPDFERLVEATFVWDILDLSWMKDSPASLAYLGMYSSLNSCDLLLLSASKSKSRFPIFDLSEISGACSWVSVMRGVGSGLLA